MLYSFIAILIFLTMINMDERCLLSFSSRRIQFWGEGDLNRSPEPEPKCHNGAKMVISSVECSTIPNPPETRLLDQACRTYVEKGQMVDRILLDCIESTANFHFQQHNNFPLS